MTDDEKREIDEAFEVLIRFAQRLAQYSLDLIESGVEITPTVRDAIEKASRIADYITYLAVEIIDSDGGRGKVLALTLFNVLLLDLEYFFRVGVKDVPMETSLIEEAKRRAEHMRSFIARKSASFYDQIVEQAFKEHIEAHGPWTDRESKLARKLKPEIDRRATAEGGSPLEVDTITRRLKPLIARTRH